MTASASDRLLDDPRWGTVDRETHELSMILDSGGFSNTLGTIFVHYCGFAGGNDTNFCTCGHTKGITIANNYVPWGETVCAIKSPAKV